MRPIVRGDIYQKLRNQKEEKIGDIKTKVEMERTRKGIELKDPSA